MLPFPNRIAKPSAGPTWWQKNFGTDERAAIENAFRPLGSISAESLAVSDNPEHLGRLAGHLKIEPLRNLGYRLLERADKLVSDATPILSLHFYWQARGEFFYRWRELDDFALEEAIVSFERQIGMASNALAEFKHQDAWPTVPGHAGYRQLRIIEEKRGNLTLAKALCLQAQKEGWADNWSKHITRIDQKIARQTQ